MTEILAQPEGTYWHFLDAGKCLGYGDGRKIEVGGTLVSVGIGLLSAEKSLDALLRASGNIACLVTLGGEVIHGNDIAVSQEQTVLWMHDVTRLLREFGCIVAKNALIAEREAGREPDPRSFAVIEVMRRYIRGDAGDQERKSAHNAAYDVVSNAADDAVNDVPNDKIGTPAYMAAYKAAYSALDWDEYWLSYIAATGTAAYRAMREEHNALLTSMLMAEYAKETANHKETV